MNDFIYNFVLVNTTRAWETVKNKRPNKEMPLDSIESVGAIISIADEIYSMPVIQSFISASPTEKLGYWERNTAEGFSDSFIHRTAVELIIDKHL